MACINSVGIFELDKHSEVIRLRLVRFAWSFVFLECLSECNHHSIHDLNNQFYKLDKSELV